MVVANFISPIRLCLGTKGLFAFAVRSYQRLRIVPARSHFDSFDW